jgi:hypothetical protein
METRSTDPAGLSVMIGMPAYAEIPVPTVVSLLGTYHASSTRGVRCEAGIVAGSSVVSWARDQVLDLFLQSDCNRLFWIDSDMAWRPDDFFRLLAHTQAFPVVAAAYPLKDDTARFIVAGIKPAEHGLLEVDGVGLGFTVMRREVVAAVAAKAPRVRDEVSGREMAAVFRVDCKGVRTGEDIAFFEDIRACGFKVLVDPAIRLGHIGQKVYTASLSDALQRP